MKRKCVLYPYQIREYLINLKKFKQVQMDAKYLKFVLYDRWSQGN